MMFGPGLHVRRGQGPNGQPVRQDNPHLCVCSCHAAIVTPSGNPLRHTLPMADKGRFCSACVEEMSRPWTEVLESIT